MFPNQKKVSFLVEHMFSFKPGSVHVSGRVEKFMVGQRRKRVENEEIAAEDEAEEDEDEDEKDDP